MIFTAQNQSYRDSEICQIIEKTDSIYIFLQYCE